MSRNKKKTIFISGARGFVGRHIKNYLNKDYKLFTPDKKTLNLNNIKFVKKYFKKCRPDIVIHLAASTKSYLKKVEEKKNQINDTYNTTKNLVKSINPECKLVIFFGSMEEYGNIKSPFKESQFVNPVTNYGIYKHKSYLYVSKYLKKKNLNYIWLRPSLVFGHGDNKDRYLGHIIQSIKKKKIIKISPGTKKRDYLYIEDLCKIVGLIIKNKNINYRCILNVSSQNYITLNKIPNLIEKILKKTINFRIVKKNEAQINLLLSNKKLKKLFPNIKFNKFVYSLKKTLRYEELL